MGALLLIKNNVSPLIYFDISEARRSLLELTGPNAVEKD